MYNPLISIVTVTFNSARTLQATLESVIAQSYANIEHVIVDGGSSDGTMELIEQYRDRLAHVTSEKDEGISDAFNKGIRAARGEIVCILNSDDCFTERAVERVVREFEASGADIVMGSIIEAYPNGERKLKKSDPSLLEVDMTVNHGGMFVKKSVYDEHGLFRLDMKYAMDYELMLRFSRRGVRFAVVDEPLVEFSMDGNSARNWQAALKEVQRAKTLNGLNPAAAYLYYLAFVFRKKFLFFLPRVYFKSMLGFFKKG